MNKKKEIENLKIAVDHLKDEIWEVQNPFKFNIKDKVCLKNDTIYYRVVDRYYKHYTKSFFLCHGKIYKLFNCDDCQIYTQKENEIELYKGENKK